MLTRRDWLQKVHRWSAATLVGLPSFAHSSTALAQRVRPAAEAGSSGPASDQDSEESSDRLAYDLPKTERWRCGLILKTPVTCLDVFATFPIPRDWPEQQVELVGQTIDPVVTNWEMREASPGAKQVALAMKRVSAGSTVEISFDFSIQRSRIIPSGATDDLVLPPRNSRPLRPYLGNSPHIDASHPRIKRVSRELAADPAATPWQRVERIYDWVRDNIKYVAGDLKNASVALKDGKGDCEEMTSLVVALCRNARVPARMVWVHEHCYPEFYLEDSNGQGTWFPCQAAGTRQFGQMEEYRPILSKGDRFKVEESRSPVRYVAEFFRCDRKGKGKPKPIFIRKPIDA